LQITVRLFATFREGRQKEQIMDVAEGSTPECIFNLLEIQKAEVALLLINGRDGHPEKTLADGDILSLFPPVGGG